MYQAILYLLIAWEEVTSKTISNCFAKALKGIHPKEQTDENDEPVIVNDDAVEFFFDSNFSFNDFVLYDDELAKEDEQQAESFNRIEQCLMSSNSTTESKTLNGDLDSNVQPEFDNDDDAENETESVAKVPLNEVFKAIQTLMNHCATSGEGTFEEQKFLSSYLEKVHFQAKNSSKQQLISDYFKKM